MREVCGIIVTYNRKELLIRNINSILGQSYPIDLLIYDNASSDGTYEFLKEKIRMDETIHYVRSEKNTGGSGGFNASLKIAFDMGYKWFLLMDDDGYAYNKETIRELMNVANNYWGKSVIINSLVVCDHKKTLTFELDGIKYYDEAIETASQNVINDVFSPFNGTLCSRECVSEIGFPRKEYFVYGDEIEYGCRARKRGIPILTAVKSVYFHPDVLDAKKIYLFSKRIDIFRKEPLWKSYCATRNYVCTYSEYYSCIKVFKYILKRIYIALHYKDRMSRLKYTLIGAKDGLQQNFSRKVPF